MSKVTSKRQVTVPKALAEKYGIEAGAELDWQPAGDVIRVIPPGAKPQSLDVHARLVLFDAATRRQSARQDDRRQPDHSHVDRGWTRDDLYDRDAR